MIKTSKIVIVTGGYGSGKTTLLQRLSYLSKDQKATILIFDFVKRVEELLSFNAHSVDILPLGCASCDDTTLYAQQITQRAQDVKIAFVEIPADKINIGGVIEALKKEGYTDIDLIGVDRDGQKQNGFESANLSRAGIVTTAIQEDISTLLGEGYKDTEEGSIDMTNRNHIAGGLLKPLITKEEILTFFNQYKNTITRLKGQMYDATAKKRYDIAYAPGEEYITFTPTQKADRYSAHTLSIMSDDKDTRTVFNSTFLGKNEDGNYIKLSNISHDESILYELVLHIDSIENLFRSVEHFTEDHLSYLLLFNKGNESYLGYLGIDNEFKNKYIIALMHYFTRIGQQWNVAENTRIIAEDFKKLSLPLYYISNENTSIEINSELKERFVREIGKEKLLLIIALLKTFSEQNTAVCNENAPYEYRPSTLKKYRSLCLLK